MVHHQADIQIVREIKSFLWRKDTRSRSKPLKKKVHFLLMTKSKTRSRETEVLHYWRHD